MAITKKQQIRGVRILLTVFYGFLLSSIISHYLLHGIFETIRRPNPMSIIMIVLGTIILVSMALATYATWYRIKKLFFSTKYVFFFFSKLGLTIQ